MYIRSGTIELDLHGKKVEDAVRAAKKAVLGANRSVYRIRLIHGYHGGTAIKRAILEEFAPGRDSKVLRVESGVNPGITELVLRELY